MRYCRIGRCTFALLPSAALAGCKTILSPIGPVDAAERIILLDSLAVMLAIVVPTILAILAVAWWFRASNGAATRRPEWSYSGRIELVVWSIPALVILFLGGIIWSGSYDLDPKRPLASNVKPLEIDVVSLDWKWLFLYPQQGIASVNRLVVPAGVPLHFRITSASVFNVFFVPRLGSEIYAMNGMVTQLNLEADKTGTYGGLSAHFSGDGFSDMAFAFVALKPQQFAGWVAAARRSGPVLDANVYRALLRQSRNISPYIYRGIAPGLFNTVATQALPPGEGPQSGRGGTGVSPH